MTQSYRDIIKFISLTLKKHDKYFKKNPKVIKTHLSMLLWKISLINNWEGLEVSVIITWLGCFISCKLLKKTPGGAEDTPHVEAGMYTDTSPPSHLHLQLYSGSVIGFCEGALFVVLQVKEAPSSCTNSAGLVQSLIEHAWGWVGVCRREGRVFNRQDAACAGAPELQHLPRFT